MFTIFQNTVLVCLYISDVVLRICCLIKLWFELFHNLLDMCNQFVCVSMSDSPEVFLKFRGKLQSQGARSGEYGLFTIYTLKTDTFDFPGACCNVWKVSQGDFPIETHTLIIVHSCPTTLKFSGYDVNGMLILAAKRCR